MSAKPDPAQSERHICGAEQRVFGVQCQLDHGHDSAHRHEDANGVTTWEPRYVAEMRRKLDIRNDEVADLREAIRDVGSAWRGGADEEIATAIQAATDFAGLSEQGGG